MKASDGDVIKYTVILTWNLPGNEDHEAMSNLNRSKLTVPSSVGSKKGVVPAIEGSVKTSEDLYLLYIHNNYCISCFQSCTQLTSGHLATQTSCSTSLELISCSIPFSTTWKLSPFENSLYPSANPKSRVGSAIVWLNTRLIGVRRSSSALCWSRPMLSWTSSKYLNCWPAWTTVKFHPWPPIKTTYEILKCFVRPTCRTFNCWKQITRLWRHWCGRVQRCKRGIEVGTQKPP